MITDEPHITIKAKMIGGSAKAWHLERLSDGEEFWVPKSVSEWISHETWAIAQWFANKEGID